MLLAALFTTLLVLSNSSVYAYSALVRMYNFGVAPAVGGLKWLFVLLDFLFRAVVPIWNGWVHLLAQILRRVILPSSFAHVDVLPELLHREVVEVDERLAAEKPQVVADVAGAAAELAAQSRNQKRDVKDVQLLGHDLLGKATLKAHDGVKGQRATNQGGHVFF
jgi:hypothetical protein